MALALLWRLGTALPCALKLLTICVVREGGVRRVHVDAKTTTTHLHARQCPAGLAAAPFVGKLLFQLAFVSRTHDTHHERDQAHGLVHDGDALRHVDGETTLRHLLRWLRVYAQPLLDKHTPLALP